MEKCKRLVCKYTNQLKVALQDDRKIQEVFKDSNIRKSKTLSENPNKLEKILTCTPLDDCKIPQNDGLLDISSSSSSSSENSPFFQVDGNQESPRKINTFNGLTAFDGNSELMSTVINVFRSFEDF